MEPKQNFPKYCGNNGTNGTNGIKRIKITIKMRGQGYIEKLSPERRFDQTLYFTVRNHFFIAHLELIPLFRIIHSLSTKA